MGTQALACAVVTRFIDVALENHHSRVSFACAYGKRKKEREGGGSERKGEGVEVNWGEVESVVVEGGGMEINSFSTLACMNPHTPA